jgi:hypothetical protein
MAEEVGAGHKNWRQRSRADRLPTPISDVAGIIRLFAQTILYVGAQLNTTSACWLSAAPSPVDGLHTMPHLRPPFCRSGCASG